MRDVNPRSLCGFQHGRAITDEDFRFKTRSWFLKEGESICPLCSRGCNILIEYHPGFPRFEVPKRVYRIKARENPEVNGFWICDRGRYGYSYLDEHRADQIIMNKIEGENVLTWENISEYLGEKIKRLSSECIYVEAAEDPDPEIQKYPAKFIIDCHPMSLSRS